MRRGQASPVSGRRLRRLCLVISTLGAGGAERVLSTLANRWAAEGHSVTLVTLSGAGDDFYRLDDSIERVGLDVIGVSRRPRDAVIQNLRRIRKLREAIVASRPDVVVSFMNTVNVLTLLAATRLGVPTIVSERIDPRAHPVGRAWSLLRAHAYSRAFAVVAQTRPVAEWMSRTMRLRRCVVIPNPISPALFTRIDDLGKRAKGTPRVAMAMGRLVEQKGFDLLIEAFASAGPRDYGWRLVIIGDGPGRKALENLAVTAGVRDIVEFTGRVDRPEALLGTADMFVLSSRYEGFPNALVEAMALGIACVAFDCRSGPADIIRDGVDGVLVPPENVAALSAAMRALMGDDVARARLGSGALEIRQRFSVDRVGAQWDALIDDAAGFRR